MIQEDKELLLKDLCARLPYGVKCHYKYYDFFGGMEQLISENNTIITGVNITLGNPIQVDGHYVEVEYVTPYLRPISSMTDEEREQYRKFSHYGAAGYRNNDYKEMITTPSFEKMDFLNAHHFDYRGLIEKGLALEASEGMYK